MDGEALAMNLQELRTPHPLRDADFAAIRARVKAEIVRKPTPWFAMFARLAFAAALVVVFVPLTRERVPDVPPTGPPASPPAVVAASRAATPRAGGETPPGQPARRRRSARRAERVAERIEIITADPTIRIIWITPKENS